MLKILILTVCIASGIEARTIFVGKGGKKYLVKTNTRRRENHGDYSDLVSSRFTTLKANATYVFFTLFALAFKNKSTFVMILYCRNIVLESKNFNEVRNI